MSRLTVSFPTQLFQKLIKAAKKSNTSINEFILMAVAKEVERREAKDAMDAWLADDTVPYEHYGPDEYDNLSESRP